LEIPQGLFVIFEELVDLSALIEGLSILGVELHCLVETLQGLLVLLELSEPKSHVEIDGRVVNNIDLIHIETLSEFINGRLDLVLLEQFTRLFLQLCR
jgi:hypothetical protein